MKKRIVVTQKDISTPLNSGERPWNCPVAKAIKRRLNKSGQEIAVGLSLIRIERIYTDTPEKVTDFIKAFDNDHPVKPIQFTLEF